MKNNHPFTDVTIECKDYGRERALNWLDKKLNQLSSFDGSLLGYVSSSPDVEQLAARFGVDPSDVLKLDANENFFVDPSFLKRLFLEVLKDVDLRFYDSQVMVDLKTSLGRYVNVSPECVMLGSGSEQLLAFITQVFLDKDDEAISIAPSFFIYEKRVRLSGAKLVTVPLNKDLSLDVDAILGKITEKTKLIFICSPNNPTGNQFSWSEIEALADKSSAIVVVDEAYAEFGDYSVCPSAVNKRNIVALRTFSKAFGLAGLRFGYAVANNDLTSVLSKIIPYTVNTVTARYAQKIIDNVEIVQKWTETVKTERERIINELHVAAGIEVLDSKTNFLTFRPHGNAEYFYTELLKRGIIVKDLGNLPLIGHCLRVTIGLPHMNDRFIKTVSEITHQ